MDTKPEAEQELDKLERKLGITGNRGSEDGPDDPLGGMDSAHKPAPTKPVPPVLSGHDATLPDQAPTEVAEDADLHGPLLGQQRDII